MSAGWWQEAAPAREGRAAVGRSTGNGVCRRQPPEAGSGAALPPDPFACANVRQTAGGVPPIRSVISRAAARTRGAISSIRPSVSRTLGPEIDTPATASPWAL